MNPSAGSSLAVRVALDALSIAIGLIAAAGLRFSLGWFEVTEAAPPTVRAHAVASGLWMGSMIGALALNRLYDEDTLFAGGGEISRVLRSTVEASAVLSVFVFLTQSFYVSRSWFGLTVLLSAVLVALQRLLIRSFLETRRRQGKFRRPAILVSRTSTDEWPFEDEHEFYVAARISPEGFDEYLAIVDASSDHDGSLARAAVVLKARDFSHDEFWRILLLAGERGWSVFVHSPVRSVGRDRLTVRELAGQTIVKVAPPKLTGARAVQKRVLDVVLALSLLVLLAPVLLVVAIAVAVGTGLPILYRQERVGLDAQTFQILKFRTMPVDAEAETGPVFAQEGDARTGSLGRFLRRTSFDELPQLWNVLKGDMSLVGPRPERPAFAGDFSKDLTWYRFRHRIRPGITGWAQSHGLRGNTSIDSRVQFDNWYIENWSVWLDLKILALTAREVLTGRNAY